MDGVACEAPQDEVAGSLAHSFHSPDERSLRVLLSGEGEGEDEASSGDPCSTDYNVPRSSTPGRASCCLDYNGPLGDGMETRGAVVTEAIEYVGSTCEEAVKMNCCTNESADPRAIKWLLTGGAEGIRNRNQRDFVPRACYVNHKYRNCQWIQYKTLDGLYLSTTVPSLNSRSTHFDEITNPQSGEFVLEEITVGCGEELPIYLYNNACRNLTSLRFHDNIGGEMTLKGDGFQSNRRLSNNFRVRATHYNDDTNVHVFSRELIYQAPSQDSGTQVDRLFADSAGLSRRIDISVVCPDSDDPPPETEPPVTQPPEDPNPPTPEIGIPDLVTFLFDHTIQTSLCPQEIGKFTIENTGDDSLVWKITNLPPWLTASPSQGRGGTEVTLLFNCQVDGPGELSGEFTIESENASNSPVTVPVGGEVHPPS